MSRSDQWIGLNGYAHSLVEKHLCVQEVGKRIYQDGKVEEFDRFVTTIPAVKKEVIREVEGAYSSPAGRLHKYTLPDGRMFTEFVQAEVWSSGPCYFIALKDEHGRIVPGSLWPEEDINNA